MVSFIDDLSQVSELEEATLQDLESVTARYPFRATPYYLSLINWKDLRDPLRIQCIPNRRELEEESGSGSVSQDPFEEGQTMPVKGLVHRFKDRVLVVATDQCALFCRHCTRKNTMRQLCAEPLKREFLAMAEYIKKRSFIREVLVSGGDPLLLDPGLLDWLLGTLGCISHVESLRIGTRLPVVSPGSVDDSLCDMLATHRPLWVNVQFNHEREITHQSVAACDRLVKRGIPVSNQSVLLKGVNDSEDEMRMLCNKLQANVIRPYYVFMCDPVKGTCHLRARRERGVEIAEALRTSVGGLSLPRFVEDLPGEKGKLPL